MPEPVLEAWKCAVKRGLPDEGLLLVVNVETQRLDVVARGAVTASYPVSTSGSGIGGAKDSHRTPPGFHEVVEWIGGHLPLGSVMKSRVPTGEVLPEEEWRSGGAEDLIVSRILRLRGLEDGVNRGEGVDSFQRYIYIHGTNHEGDLGRPASRGCIRMANHDIGRLHDDTLGRPTWCWIG